MSYYMPDKIYPHNFIKNRKRLSSTGMSSLRDINAFITGYIDMNVRIYVNINLYPTTPYTMLATFIFSRCHPTVQETAMISQSSLYCRWLMATGFVESRISCKLVVGLR